MTVKTVASALTILVLVPTLGASSAQTGTAKGSVARLPATIPIFPLPDAMLFPNVSRPLHIFEPRYRTMVADALKGDRIIGMVTLRPGYEVNYDGRPPIFPIGCAGAIVNVEELPDGRFNIVLHGLVKFHVTGEDGSHAYRLARVTAIPEKGDVAGAVALAKQRRRVEELLAASTDRFGFEPPPPSIPDADVVNTISQYLEMDDPLDRQKLLEADGPLSRSGALIDLLEKMVSALRRP